MSEPTAITLTIDNRTLTAHKGQTLLEVARANGIEIPTLCFLEGLSPHGGCRMCIVEVEGVRNLPTACTTPAEDGMIVRTRTAQIEAQRADILQLFLSEHTSSCLVCDEKTECKEFMPTIRKAGVTTGCRYCPKDGQCELQAVTEKMGITNIDYPIAYRGLRVETEDPFYDRDYNLCILCGRCVRMCQEVRTANVLAYKNRGRKAIIGPAFKRTHLEAGCEFCGACVAVCPTGSLREKARAWEGKPEREEITTCTFCGVGCQLRLLVKGDRVIGSLPAEDALVNRGQLCVKGRFCNTELVNGHQRIRNPYAMEGDIPKEISWEHAAALAAEQLSVCAPEDFAMLASSNLCTEDLYIAQKFTRVAMKSNQVDTTARTFYGGAFNAYLDLMALGVPLSAVHEADLLLAVGLDSRFGRSVVGVALRGAVKRGAKVVSIHPRSHSYSLFADPWIQPRPGEEAGILEDLAHAVKAGESSPNPEVDRAAQLLKAAQRPIILLGSEFMQYTSASRVLDAVRALARALGAGVMPLPPQNNLQGSLLAGAYPELLPGGAALADAAQRTRMEAVWGAGLPTELGDWNAWSLPEGKRTKVLYLLGELPPQGPKPADFLIFQNIYPPAGFSVPDLVLPAAASTEVDGTFVNGEGRIQPVRRAVAPPGNARPDWEILCHIARKMGVPGFDFKNVTEIREEMAHLIEVYREDGEEDGARRPRPYSGTGRLSATVCPLPEVSGAGEFLLTVNAVEHIHRGFPLSAWVEGSKALLTEGLLEINPADATEAGICQGDSLAVSVGNIEHVWPAKLFRDQPRGTLNASLREWATFSPNPLPVRIRKAHV